MGEEIETFKYPIKLEKRENAFRLYGRESRILFTFGDDCVVITKNEYEENCLFNKTKKSSFDFGNLEKEEKRKFEMKRLQVYQIEESEEYKQIREEEIKNKEEKIENEIQEKYENEVDELKRKKMIIYQEYLYEIEILEKWTGMKFNEIIFDSKICCYDNIHSTFNKHLMNKNNVVIVIEMDDKYQTKYGGYISTTINNYSINDDKSFVFSFMNDNPKKFEMKSEKKNEEVFHLYENWKERLFSFGNNEIVINKNECGWCECNDKSTFNYEGNKKALTGRYGQNNTFKIKRIVVIQFRNVNPNE